MAEKKQSSSHAGAIVAGIVGISAAAVGGYYLYGHKDAKKHRAQVKGWMLKAKGEVLEELEKVKDVSEGAYMSAVETVVKKYHQLKSIDPAELEDFMADMKAHWAGIKKTLQTKAPALKKAVKTAKKTSKK